MAAIVWLLVCTVTFGPCEGGKLLILSEKPLVQYCEKSWGFVKYEQTCGPKVLVDRKMYMSLFTQQPI